METDIDLIPTECDPGDSGTQRCRMSLEAMKSIGAKLGSFIKISYKNIITLCSVWPIDELNGNCFKIDRTVCVQNMKSSLRRTEQIPSIPSLEIIEVEKCSTVSATLIVSNIQDVLKWRQFLKTKSKVLNQYCKNCLLNLCVISKCYVNLGHSLTGKCYGFSGVFVHSVQTENMSDGAIIENTTVIDISEVISDEKFSLRNKYNVNKLGGLDGAMKDLVEIITMRNTCQGMNGFYIELPKGVLLRGPPGCGKTSLVRHVAAVCDATVVTINGPEIFGSRPGESEENLRKVFDKAQCLCEEGPCLLFIDEIDSLCPKRGKSINTPESRVTSQLLTLLDGIKPDSPLVVIGATNRPHSLDPSVRRTGRFDREVMINIPTTVQREEILRVHCSYLPLADDVNLREMSDWTKGYVGADLSSLAQEAAYLALRETKSYCDLSSPVGDNITKINRSHFKSAFSRIIPSTQKGSDALVDLKPVQWSDIGGLEDVKGQIKQAVEWPMDHPEAFRRMGVPVPRGILLYGPPGCCKTTLVKAAATSCKATFLSVSSAQLFSPFVGDAEKTVTEVFQRARMGAPSILFLDEVEAITGKRSESGRQRGVQERLLSTLLNEMDGIGVRLDDKMDSVSKGNKKQAEGHISDQVSEHTVEERVDNSNVLVVAATNRPDLVDEALLRPGRFDSIIYVPPPDQQARQQILEVYVGRLPAVDVSTETLARQTEWFTGAELENLCREAALLALVQDGMDTTLVKQEHFDKALKNLQPSLDEHLVKKYKCLKPL